MIGLNAILAFAFLAPWLMAAGAAATSIPIVIHLLNKRKFRVVIWAAMDWLLAAQRRNARRLRFQRWLLLAIRCMAILIIAAGIAQLVLQSRTLGGLLGEERVAVIIWDDSYSMGFQQADAGPGGAGDGGSTAFDKSKRLIANFVGRLKSADKVMVIRAGTGGPIIAANSKPTLDHAAILAQVNAAKVTDAATDLPGAFDRAAQVLKESQSTTRTRQLLVLTDFSSSSIHDQQRGNGANNAIQEIEGDKLKKAALAANTYATDFRLVDMGVEDQANMAVTSVLSKRPAVVAGIPTDLQIQVYNGTDREQLDVPLTVLLDGVPVRTEKLGKMDAGAFRDILVPVTVPTIGRHLVETTLPADSLPIDDTRRLMVNVRREIPVLLVDGSPGDGGRTSYGSTFYLYAAYAIPADNKPASMFAPKIITELELPTTPLNGYDAVVLSDTADPGPAMRDNLRKFVEAGGLLMIFPGNRTNAQRMNDALGENGAKLLPATLGQPVKLEGADQVAQGIAFAPEGYQHQVLQVFSSAYKEGKEVGFATVQTTQYVKLGVPADGSTETVLRYANKDGTPGDAAVVMKRDIGKGTVVLFAGSADMAWNTWGAKPSYLPFLHELTFYSMGRGTLGTGAGLTLEVGAAFHLPADIASAGAWTGPRDTRVNVISELDKEGRAHLTSPPLNMAGTYTPASGDGRPVVAVNPESGEADIRHVPATQMAAMLGLDPRTILQRPSMLDWNGVIATDEGGSFLGPGLISTALGLFLLETVLAMAFSMYR